MAANDLLTLGEGKVALQISEGDSVNDDTLAVYISAVSELLDQEIGPVVRRTIDDERHDGGRQLIFLRHRPVFAITSVTEHQGTAAITVTAEAAGTVPGQAYLAEFYEPEPALFSGELRRRSGGYDYRWWCGRQNIVVDYTPGRYANTAEVPIRIKRAAGITLVNLWRDQGPSVDNDGEVIIPFASFPTFAIPNAAKELLSREIGLDAPWGYR